MVDLVPSETVRSGVLMTRNTSRFVLVPILWAVLLFASSEADAILNGELDTTNQAVGVWLHGSKCSGVMIAKVGSTGWVLTAANCVGGSLGAFYEGNDHNNPDRTYAVVEAIVHPDYATDPTKNFALLRVSGVDSSTPTLSPVAPFEDQVTTGTTVTLSGYGLTESGSTSWRHSGLVVLTTVSPTEIQSGASVYAGSGDSGGAAIVSIQGVPRLAGIISHSDSATYTACARVSAVYVDFLVENIGLPLPPIFADSFESGDTGSWSKVVP